MITCCNKCGNMCNVCHKKGIYAFCYFCKTFKINNFRIIACATNYKFWFIFFSKCFNFVIINFTIFINSIAYNIKIKT